MKMDKNTTLSVMAILVATVACIASIRSCSISREALKAATSQFIAEKRPYLAVDPAKFSKSNKYLEVERTKDGKARLHLRLKLENIGNVAAIDIRSEVLPAIGKEGPIPTKVQGTPNPLTLGPGQHVFRNYDFRFSGDQPNYARKAVDSMRKNPMEIWESFRYRSEVDTSVEYETRIGYRFTTDDMNLLLQETKRISGSIVVPRP